MIVMIVVDVLAISIHALAKRATSAVSEMSLWTFLFQSTPSQRGRRPQTYLKQRPYTISIHALAKRATAKRCMTAFLPIYFNPRPRKEGDTCHRQCFTDCLKFQSTPSQRGRPRLQDIWDLTATFQSTPSQRGRHLF